MTSLKTTTCKCGVETTNRHGRCNECNAAYMREYRARNPNYGREMNFKKKYGITLAEYEAKLAEQEGVCAICGEPEIVTFKGRLRLLCVDHNHETDEVRDLLCAHCNQILGLAQEDPERLRTAAAYLEFWK